MPIRPGCSLNRIEIIGKIPVHIVFEYQTHIPVCGKGHGREHEIGRIDGIGVCLFHRHCRSDKIVGSALTDQILRRGSVPSARNFIFSHRAEVFLKRQLGQAYGVGQDVGCGIRSFFRAAVGNKEIRGIGRHRRGIGNVLGSESFVNQLAAKPVIVPQGIAHLHVALRFSVFILELVRQIQVGTGNQNGVVPLVGRYRQSDVVIRYRDHAKVFGGKSSSASNRIIIGIAIDGTARALEVII